MQEVAQLVTEGIPEQVKAEVGGLVMDSRFNPYDVARLRKAAVLRQQEQHHNISRQVEQHNRAEPAPSVRQMHAAPASPQERQYTTFGSRAAGAPCAQQWGPPSRVQGLLSRVRPPSALQQLAAGEGFTKLPFSCSSSSSMIVSKSLSSGALPCLETEGSLAAGCRLDMTGMSHHSRGSVNARGAHAFASFVDAFEVMVKRPVVPFINGMLSRPIVQQMSKALRQLC